MHADVAAAHIATLREWADVWATDAEQDSGCGEVAFLLRRAARVAEAVVKGEATPSAPPPLPDAVARTDTRDG